MHAWFDLLERVQKDLELEDILLTLVVVLLASLSTRPAVLARLAALPPGVQWLLLLIFIWSGYLVSLGTRVAPAPPALQGLARVLRGVWMGLIYLAQVVGVPCFALLLAARDNGEQIRLGIFAVLSVCAALSALRPRARRLRVRVRRWLLLPLTLYNSWYLYEVMAHFLAKDGYALQRGAQALVERRYLRYLSEVLLDRVLAFTLFLVVPYGVLVVAPRLLAGEAFQVRPWLKRYLFFVTGLTAGFVVDTLRRPG